MINHQYISDNFIPAEQYKLLANELLISQNNYNTLLAEHQEIKSNYFILQQQIAQLQRIIFGSKHERFVPLQNPLQTSLELGIEPTAVLEVTPQKVEEHTRHKVDKKSNHKGRLPLPEHLPRNVIELEPQENIEGLVCIGTEVKEELELSPGKLFVNRYERKKYAKPDGEGIIIAPLPAHPIAKCMAGTGLLAQILIDKYADHLPLYRQAQRYQREGVSISTSTFNDWVRDSCNILEPLYDVLKKQTIQSDYLMVDETPIKVLESNKKGATHRGYYWVYKSPHDALVIVEYQKGRGREGPTEMLKDFKGNLQTDGYGVYDIFETNKDITLSGCMAHARRYFDQSRQSDKQRSEFVLQQIQLLYDTERKARDMNLAYGQRYELRQKESMPVLAIIRQWMQDNITQVTPKSPIGQAITYSLARWEKLCRYTTNGKLEIDNNPVENAIRPIAIGRKNYLFAGSHESAQRAAMMYSFLSICKIKNVNPFTWLKNTLDNISDCKSSVLHTLLP